MGCYPRSQRAASHTSHKSLEEMKQIVIRVTDDLVPLLEEWVKHIPEMEIVSCKESKEYELDEMDRRMTLALQTLIQNDAIRYGYDFTWVMVAIGDGVIEGLGRFRSPQSFMDYLATHGVEHVPSRTTISTWNNRVVGTYPNWEFTDTQDPQEILRRKNIVQQLISALNRL